MDYTSPHNLNAEQQELEIRHANFRQKPLLVEYFDGYFPKKEYLTDVQDEDYKHDEAWDEFKRFQKMRKLGIDVASMVSLYKRLPLEALVNLFKHEDSQTIATVAEKLTESRWIHWDPEREEFVTRDLPKDLLMVVFTKRYPMPMICQPNKLLDEQDSAYLTEIRSQSILGEYSGQVSNLSTLNNLNRIPLLINKTVMDASQDTFKNDDKFRQDSATVFNRIADKVFYLTWQFDFRGRVYARGYHVNPQGDDWHKHVIQFA